jgi:hypothetical protein
MYTTQITQIHYEISHGYYMKKINHLCNMNALGENPKYIMEHLKNTMGTIYDISWNI